LLTPHLNHRTHIARIDADGVTGRKLINSYEVIEEIGRGMHGKVKLARNLETGESVAIKIIPRFSKKRRLGKVMALSPQDKTKREIAILKKIRHPNVVALLEVIDDPELKKIYMVLEHVELGEVVWRKKGLPHICQYERRRIERETRGDTPSAEEEQYDQLLERRQAIKELKRAKLSQTYANPFDFWSIEYGAAEDGSTGPNSRIPSRDDLETFDRLGGNISSLPSSLAASRATSRAPSRTQSVKSMGQAITPQVAGSDTSEPNEYGDAETPGPLRSNPNSSTALDGTMYGAYVDDPAFRGRSPSMADSIISHMSSVDFNPQAHDPFADDYSYVPCFTLEQARSTFRDTVLGLEYLHYQGVVHRDIKPANLLWTKDHRVKISDFGVSYFGRPIRDGEPDETVSESEARDFDDDLELAKTVGTPAFFAPELCYTDLDQEQQPKVSEQIDVWSLGVTLYCLIYARIPFLGVDEFQMFRKIATEEVYIPRRRLRPVDPSTSPKVTSLYKRQNSAPYRDDNELAYEDIDNLLYDLLRQMLTKNPDKRIRLRDIKRHPWVVQGVPNPIGWLDDTDPNRPSSGRRIQVNEGEMSRAVVPITFLERARSAMKKAVGKVMHPLGERVEPKARRRAASNATSSGGDSTPNLPQTPHPRDARRKSLRGGDDYFTNAKDYSSSIEHPLTRSLTASPSDSPTYDPLATAIAEPLRAGRPSGEHIVASPAELSFASSSSSALHRTYPRHSHSRSMGGPSFLPLTPGLPDAKTMPASPSFDGLMDDPSSALRKARDMQPTIDDASRSKSMDRGLFASHDKRAQPKVSLSTAVAPGSIQRPKHPRPIRSIDLSRAFSGAASIPSPIHHSPRSIVNGYQHGQPNSDSNIYESQRLSAELDERPQTAHRVENISESRGPTLRSYSSSIPTSLLRGKDVFSGEYPQELYKQEEKNSMAVDQTEVDPAHIRCPPSPEEDLFDDRRPAPSREETINTINSSSSTSMGILSTPLTSPSELVSPVSMTNCTSKPSSEPMLVFQSDPSLPALLSGASSVSADLEGELLGQPGVVNTHADLLETSDSLTPPALGKDPVAGFPLEHALADGAAMDSGIIPVKYDTSSVRRDLGSLTPEPRPMDDDDDSDSDEGLTMAKSKKKKKVVEHTGRIMFSARRRDTNASIGSTETAKKVGAHSED
jgi:SNF1-activating kinase 1